ncbi:MAG: heavy metal-binding domain-containing protein [Planctomycetota bacterium]|jgi:uncharacterized protein with PIN domain
MKSPWLVLGVAVAVVALSSPTVLADHCCGGGKAPEGRGDRGDKGTDATPTTTESTVSVHGGTLTKQDAYVFETAVHRGHLRVYVFDAKGKALPVSKLKAEARIVPEGTKKRVIRLKPKSVKKGRQSYLTAKHDLALPAPKGSNLEVTLRGLGSDRKGTATYKVPLAETPVVHYACPMHPDQRAEDPGKCGKCGMALNRSAQTAPRAQPRAKASYACPMHPKVTSDKPGRCPDCGMSLKKVKQAEKAAYSCPMHPKVTSDKPGKCPDCGMSLRKVKQAEQAAYSCPMHPRVTSDKPGRCPDCGMSLKKTRAEGKGKG